MEINMVIFFKVIKKGHNKGIHIHNEGLLCELAELLYLKRYEKRDTYEQDYLENQPIFLVKILQNNDYERNCN